MLTKSQAGQSLVEVLVVLAVATVIMISLIAVILMGLKNSQFAQNQTRATKYAQEALEQIKTIRDRDLNISLQGVGAVAFQYFIDDGSKCPLESNPCYFKLDGLQFEELPQPGDTQIPIPRETLTRQISAFGGSGAKTFVAKVVWRDSAGPHESNLQTILTRR